MVGDDDQSLYRFRGASVENILNFPGHFPDCHTVALTINYRSHPSIVRFYDDWMATAADWSNPEGGPPFRHAKTIRPHDPGAYGDYPAVIAVAGNGPADEGQQIGELLRFLKRHEVIAEYGQAALLLPSVRHDMAGPYLDALEVAGIPALCVPSGGSRDDRGHCRELTVTTIHQSKGREWDVVITGSLNLDHRNVDPVGRSLLSYCGRGPFEPADRIADFDHARQSYVAFSRAKYLLVLTASGQPHGRFDNIWEGLPRWTEVDRSGLKRQRFRSEASDAGRGAVATPVLPPPGVIPYLKRLHVRMGRR